MKILFISFELASPGKEDKEKCRLQKIKKEKKNREKNEERKNKEENEKRVRKKKETIKEKWEEKQK